MSMFQKSKVLDEAPRAPGFSYLKKSDIYMDSACQTLRPEPVIAAMQEYYETYNACGGRVKYEWGRKVDQAIGDTRRSLLALCGKSDRDYSCSFTLNTTYGLNLLLSQLPADRFSQIITSDIEHNSVFLPTIQLAERLGIPRRVLERGADGTLIYDPADLQKPTVVVVNAASNIDGRLLQNAKQLAHDVHKGGGILIIDGAQLMGHDAGLIREVDFDGLCFSGHKMYGPSIGIVIVKKSLLGNLDYRFIGGGMVEDVSESGYTLTRADLDSRLEPGLQNFAAIIGLQAAISWQNQQKSEDKSNRVLTELLADKLYHGLSELPGVTMLNNTPSQILSFYADSVDAHRLAVYLSAEGIMARSGYFCCHYYLSTKHNYPPLLRLSLGKHNTEADIDHVLTTLQTILRKA